MRVGPIGAAHVMATGPEQERLEPKLRILERESRRVTGATEIADGFILDGRHVHGRQIARPEQSREFDGIASVGLHLVAGLFRDERWRDDVTGESLAGPVAMECVAARSGLVGKDQRGRLRLQAPDQFVEVRLARTDRAHKHGRIGALPLGMGDGGRIFVDVQTDEQRSRLGHADLREHSAAVHAALRLWPNRLTRDHTRGQSCSVPEVILSSNDQRRSV
jgi:hypothetical protein